MNFITRFKRGRTRHYEAHNALHNVGPVKPDVMKAHARSAAEPPAITDAYKANAHTLRLQGKSLQASWRVFYTDMEKEQRSSTAEAERNDAGEFG